MPFLRSPPTGRHRPVDGAWAQVEGVDPRSGRRSGGTVFTTALGSQRNVKSKTCRHGASLLKLKDACGVFKATRSAPGVIKERVVLGPLVFVLRLTKQLHQVQCADSKCLQLQRPGRLANILGALSSKCAARWDDSVALGGEGVPYSCLPADSFVCI